jgi:hypothetical protein
MSPLDLLELPEGADERAIKRAYAKQLRFTRPDDDPEGFQRLHAAYQAALECCRDTQSDETSTWHEPAPVASASIPSAPYAALGTPAAISNITSPIERPAPIRFDHDTFCKDAFALAATGDAAALQEWLAARQELWSFQLKTGTGDYLVGKLYREAPPMPVNCMEGLLGFFNLDQVLVLRDPLALLRLQRRMRLAWQLQFSDEASLGTRLAIRTPLERARAHWIVDQLKRPFRWPRALWLGTNFVNPELIAEFIKETSDQHPKDLPDTINRHQVDFWLAAADRRRVTPPRLILGGVRSAAMLLLSVLLAPLLSLLYTNSVSLHAMLVVVGLLMLPSALWAIWMAWSVLFFWYLKREEFASSRFSHSYLSARTWLVPALCAVGIALGTWTQGNWGLVVLFPSLWMATRCYWLHHSSRYAPLNSGYVRLMFLVLIPVVQGAINAGAGRDLVSLGLVVAAATMLAWAADQRTQYQRRAKVR